MAAVSRAYTQEYYISPSEYAMSMARNDYAGTNYAGAGYANTYAGNYASAYADPQPREDVFRKKVRVKREEPTIKQVKKPQSSGPVVSGAVLAKSVVLMVIAAALLIGIVLMGAITTDIKYSINKINKENVALENDIALINVKLEGASGIETIEAYATKQLHMKYPGSDECIYIDAGATVDIDLVKTIKEKAYPKES